MASKGGIVWTGDLPANIRKVNGTVKAAMSLACRVNAPRIESWMKTNAPWTDQTGAARNGLTARHRVDSPTSDTIVLSGSVPYQIWLETRWSGRYAIIGPAVRHWAPLVMTSVSQYVAARMRKIT